MDFETLLEGMNCTPPAIDDFMNDIFTVEQRRKGAVAFHILVSLYLFVALAVVCDKFFVPAVEKICHALNMTADVAGATFMAAATSAPELFVNVIGTFITEGDIGVGTIVGSAVFNILAVGACCGLGAGMVVPLDWWPLTRDCLAYGVTVSILIGIIHDERVEWYEALALVLLYYVYILIMYFDQSIQRFVKTVAARLNLTQEHPAPTPTTKLSLNSVEAAEAQLSIKLPTVEEGPPPASNDQAENEVEFKPEETEVQNNAHLNGTLKLGHGEGVDLENNKVEGKAAEIEEEEYSLWRWPKKSSTFTKVAWVVTWPIHLIYYSTIPDCNKPRFKKWFPLTFIMCIVWIGSLSYVVAWMITIIGDTLKIPDSVMGITFLAAGTSIPEAVSSVIVAKQGHGSMGISNSIGSNTFDILLCLGLPWFIKAAFLPTIAGKHWVGINSAGIEYSAISLLSSLLMLYATFAFNKFKLDKKVGRICLFMYAVFLILASMIELNTFFVVNLPTCGR